MATTLTAYFDTRRAAEMTVERLVQEQGLERTDIFIVAEGDENSAGDETAGSDGRAGSPTPETRDDAALTGRILVSVDIEDDAKSDAIRQAFEEFVADDIAQT